MDSLRVIAERIGPHDRLTILPVNEITMQEEYSAQIEIPDNNNENALGAVINAKILFYWSDYKNYVDKKMELN